MSETFGQRLGRLRRERGLSIPALAKLVGVTDSAVRQLESGESKSASLAVGIRLAEVLQVDPAALAFGEGATLAGRVLALERRMSAMETERADERRLAAEAAAEAPRRSRKT